MRRAGRRVGNHTRPAHARICPEMPLSPKQLTAIDVLLTVKTFKDAAATVEVDQTTLRRWLKDQEFADELRRAQREIISHNLRGVASLAGKAIATMDGLLDSRDDRIKLEAAREVFERLFDVDVAMRTDEGSNPPAVPPTPDPAPAAVQ